ncbi:uncharacterized protein LOC62_02G003410 [Vanrija pseudolonga]|uniref:Uncharacterized protein n=1 Tax=Vanrija pseudolonga TaxID=143232 RepID=A0AAF0Y4J4_9TREE|nr:hypothetical protein LOC62_02G003410 [Vanrija pseudolonga]
MSVGGGGNAVIAAVIAVSSLGDPNWASDFGVNPMTTSGSNPTNSTNPNTVHGRGGTSVGAIAGGAAGGAVGLALIAALVFFVRRKWKQLTWRIQGGGRLDLSHTTVEPFRAPSTTATATGTTQPAETDSLPKARDNAPSTMSGPSSSVHPKSLESRPMSSGTASSSSEGTSALFSLSPHAQDAGSMHAQAQLPPLYDPGWRGGGEPALDAAASTAASTLGATLSTRASTVVSEKR